MAERKIMSLEAVARELDRLRRAGRKVVQCHGCFDLLHIGHIKHLQAARRIGDALVVTITPDRYVDKGPGGPPFRKDSGRKQWPLSIAWTSWRSTGSGRPRPRFDCSGRLTT